MFNLLAHMKWAHLPVAGGLYDQDPDLLDRFAVIFGEIDKVQAEEQREHEEKIAEQRAKNNRPAGRGRRGR